MLVVSDSEHQRTVVLTSGLPGEPVYFRTPNLFDSLDLDRKLLCACGYMNE